MGIGVDEELLLGVSYLVELYRPTHIPYIYIYIYTTHNLSRFGSHQLQSGEVTVTMVGGMVAIMDSKRDRKFYYKDLK